jgi:hypothetical protein
MSVESSVVSFVERIGKDIMHGLSDAAIITQKIQPVANFVGSIIDTIEPGLAPAVTSILAVSTYVEGQFAAAGNATGTGPQKLAVVTTMVGNVVGAGLTAAGKASDAASVQAFISKIVNLGKSDPALWQELLTMLSQAPAAAAVTPPPGLSAAVASAAAAAHS